MKDNFADYETSKMLKELGFDEPCLGHYWTDHREVEVRLYREHEGIQQSNSKIENNFPPTFTAPLWQEVEKWLWDKHKIVIQVTDISSRIDGYNEYEFETTIIDEHGFIDYMASLTSPIDAKINGIKNAVKHLHTQK